MWNLTLYIIEDPQGIVDIPELIKYIILIKNKSKIKKSPR